MSETNTQSETNLTMPLSVIRISGADALTFLQGQLTQDVRLVTADKILWTGLCSPKGRLLATAGITLFENDYLLILDTSLVQSIAKRLKMYILRSAVTLAVMEASITLESVDNIDPNALAAWPLERPSIEVVLHTGWKSSMALVLHSGSRPAQPTNIAYLLAMGVPMIEATTQDQFVPQGVNLELVGGVSFNKGCYTGQEVVSRVEHIGKTNRRMLLCAYPSTAELSPMMPISNTSGEEIGIIVRASQGLVLIQVPVNALDDLTFTTNDVPLTVLPLPYGWSR